MGTVRAWVAAALVGAIVAPSVSAAETTLQAVPAMGGIAKAGRSTPVQVTIDHSGADLAAELILSWGRQEVRRHVRLASSGRRQFELYIRTSAPESAVHVRLASGGADLAAVDVKLRVLPQDEPVTLCVVSGDGAAPGGAPCSAIVTAALLPRSPRGYEVVDRVVWPEGGGASLVPPAQRLAFAQWEMLRRLDQRGDLGLTPGVTRPMLDRGLPVETSRVTATFGAAYLFALVLAVVALGWSRSRIALLFAAIGAVLSAGVAGALAIGRVGPAADVTLHHESLLQQLPGTAGSVLSVQAVAEFPAFDTFTIRLPLTDAALETATATGRSAGVDEEGYPVLTGTFGLGARQAFSAEAFSPLQLLAVAEEGPTIRVTNISAFELRECRFADGVSAPGVGVLNPSASVTAQRIGEVAGPLFTCTLPESLVAFTESRRAVRTNGRTMVAAYAPGAVDD